MDTEVLEQFISDADDLIGSAEDALISLESGQGDLTENIAVLLRALHTLKGTAAFFDLTVFSSFSHYLEDMVQPFKEKGETPDSGIIAKLLDGITILHSILEGLREGKKEDDFKEEVEEFKRKVEQREVEEQEPAVEQDTAGEQKITEKQVDTEKCSGQGEENKEDKLKEQKDKASLEDIKTDDSILLKQQKQQEQKPLIQKEQKQPVAVSAAKKTGGTVAQKSVSVRKRRRDPFLKIRSQKVDELMDMVAEFGVSVAEVFHHPALKEVEVEGLEEKQHHIEVLLRKLQDVAASLRLVPVSTLFRPMQRLVRDLSRTTGKPLVLKTEGGETELDKVVVEALNDPLVHMIRNSADHGIEPPEERRANGKPEKGLITLRASQRGGEVIIEVEDDGRGLNREKILKKARERGLIGPDEEPEDRELWQFIFHPGFSTAEKITSVSGRGVGMDVVNAAVQEIRGRIEIDSKPGKGSCISICIPLTLAFLDSMIVSDNEILYAIPTENVKEVLKPEENWVVTRSADISEMVHVRNDLIPVVRLEHFYNMQDHLKELKEKLIVIVRGERGLLALPVDEIIGQQQVTIKPLQGYAKEIRAGAGWALLASGDTAIVLDCRRLG